MSLMTLPPAGQISRAGAQFAVHGAAFSESSRPDPNQSVAAGPAGRSSQATSVPPARQPETALQNGVNRTDLSDACDGSGNPRMGSQNAHLCSVANCSSVKVLELGTFSDKIAGAPD
jgi:hypothetical protein